MIKLIYLFLLNLKLKKVTHIKNYKTAFVSARDLIALVSDFISNNFILVLTLYAISSALNFIIALAEEIVRNISTSFAQIFSFAYFFIYILLSITIAYAVICYQKNKKFNSDYLFEIILDNILDYMKLCVITILAYILLKAFVGTLFKVDALIVLGVLNFIIFGSPLIYILIRYKFCIQLTGFYNSNLKNGLSKSFKLTKNKFFSLFKIYFVFIVFMSMIFFGSLDIGILSIFIYQILIVILCIIDSSITVILINTQKEVDKVYEDYYKIKKPITEQAPKPDFLYEPETSEEDLYKGL